MNTKITISNIDDTIVNKLQIEANKFGRDLNSYLILLLKKSAGIYDTKRKDKQEGKIDALAGTWSVEEYDEFISSTNEFRIIDDKLWE